MISAKHVYNIPPKRKNDNEYKEIELKPIIQNENSSFVVVTYWWGRGNINKNLQKPCPNVIEETLKNEGRTLSVRKQGKKFEEMIDDWVNNMKKRKVNYLVAEYPMFAVKGGYQNAINYKPYFIEEALRVCYPRSVLYIDGDMKINVYPRILDTPGVDFAGRAWGIDLDAWNMQDPCYDPYVFETSGGTLFFGQTLFGYQLLHMWQEAMKLHVGKAEDRVISLIVNNKKLMRDMNMIQLPIEYLWLNLLYEHEDTEIDLKKYRKPMISHPFCLTSEEAAVELSDELLKKMKSRIPYKYNHYVEGNILCGRDDIIYEYILYDDKKTATQHKRYNEWSKKLGSFKVIEYDDRYGSFNKIANSNIEKARSISRMLKENTVSVTIDRQYDNIAHITTKDMLIPTILSYLKNGQSVIYLPNKVKYITKTVASISKKIKESYQLIARNKNDSENHFKKGYMLTLDEYSPIYFSAENKILYHLIAMSENLKQIGQHFNSSSSFLTRIRCYWL